jgi:dTDP-4-amino-4,6-dideoxygalactose transaminase
LEGDRKMAKLAINGGNPVRTKPFTQWPQGGKAEMDQLEKVLKAGQWGTLGNEALAFAEKFAQYNGVNYGISVNNGTISLELILRGLNIGYGDEVIVPSYTFISTASAVAIAGATPVFADIESGTYNIDPASIEANITPKTKAIIAVHVGGRPCNMDRIMEIAKKHGIYVIEDCAQAHGSQWKDKKVGSIGHAGSFSFQESKNVTSGEGGAIITDDLELFKKFWHFHNSGRAYDLAGEFSGVMLMGTNARMTEWQAAVLTAQLDKLDEQIDRRMENVNYLNSKLKQFDFIKLLDSDECITKNTYHLFIMKYDSDGLKGIKRERFISAMNAEGIPCSKGYVPLYKMDAFSTPNFRKSTGSDIDYSAMYLENTEKACNVEALWLTGRMLLGSIKDMDDIIEAMDKVGRNIEEI